MPEQGFFVLPTIFDHVSNNAPIAQEETFGPVVAFIRFEQLEDALQMANDSAYGLAGYIQTADGRNATQLSQALEAGIIWVNGCPGIQPYMPFGGQKNSGFGRVGGMHGMMELMRTKSVWFASAPPL